MCLSSATPVASPFLRSCTAAAAEAAPNFAGEPTGMADYLEWALGRQLTKTWFMLNIAFGESQTIPSTQLLFINPQRQRDAGVRGV